MRKKLSMISILAVMGCVILQVIFGSIGGSKVIGTQTPFRTYYTDPSYFTDMELDVENNVIYLGTGYGIIVKDIENGESRILNQYCGFKDPSIIDLEWDEKGHRLFVSTSEVGTIYILDTRNLTIKDKISLDDEEIYPFNSIAYDSSNDVLYMSDGKRVFRYSMGDDEFDLIDFTKMETIEKHLMYKPYIHKILFSDSTRKLVLATNQGLKVIDIENMNLTYSSRFDGGTNDIYDIILNDHEDVVFFIQGNVRRYDLYNNLIMNYPFVVGYEGSSFTTQRLGYDPVRDELYCSIKEDFLLVFKGSAPELVDVYHYKGHTDWYFTYLTICRIIYVKNKDMMLFGSGYFTFKGGGGYTFCKDGQARLAWYDPDEEDFINIDIVRRNPGYPDYSDYYTLETSPYIEGLALGNEETLFILDEEFEVMKDFQGIIEGVLDMECSGTDLYICARNGTFAYGLLNNSLRRIDLGTNAIAFSIEVGERSNSLYLGTREGIVIYDPIDGNKRSLRVDETNATNGNPEDYSLMEYLVPGGLCIEPMERFGFLCSLYPNEVLEIDLVEGKFRYLNNLTITGTNETKWQKVTVSKVVYSDEIGGPILLTNKGLMNEKFEPLLNLPVIGPLNWMNIDEKRDILYAVTGEFVEERIGISQPDVGEHSGLFMIDLNDGTWKVSEFKDGVPSTSVKGATYDEYRDRFYFAGGRSFFYIEREDIDVIVPLYLMEAKTIHLHEEQVKEEEVIDDDKGQRKEDNGPIMIGIVSILLSLFLLIFLQRKRDRPIHDPRAQSILAVRSRTPSGRDPDNDIFLSD